MRRSTRERTECLEPRPDVNLATAAAGALAPVWGLPEDELHRAWTARFAADADFYLGKDALTGLEEQADDFSMTVLHTDGGDANDMGEAILAGWPQALVDYCRGVLATDAVPRYGVTDAHHTHCYRAYPSRAFKAWLSSGGAGIQLPASSSAARRAFDPSRDPIAID